MGAREAQEPTYWLCTLATVTTGKLTYSFDSEERTKLQKKDLGNQVRCSMWEPGDSVGGTNVFSKISSKKFGRSIQKSGNLFGDKIDRDTAR